MLAKRIIIAAAAIYLCAVGCVLWPSSSSAKDPVDSTRLSWQTPFVPAGLPYRGVGMQIQRVDWIDKYEKSIDQIADLGADTVLLVVDSRQENGKSSRIYLDMRMTPTPLQLGELI